VVNQVTNAPDRLTGLVILGLLALLCSALGARPVDAHPRGPAAGSASRTHSHCAKHSKGKRRRHCGHHHHSHCAKHSKGKRRRHCGHHHHHRQGLAVPPPVGTVLTTYNGAGRLNVIPGYAGAGTDGFSIVESVLEGPGFSTDASTVTAFDVAGGQLARLKPGSLTGECGAADIAVPGPGRLLITLLVSKHEAEGIVPFTYSVALQAWNADTGQLVWDTTLVPQTAEEGAFWGSLGGTECQAYDGNLRAFSATTDGRWGVELEYERHPGGYIINLATGAVRKDPNVLGTIGNFVVDGTGEEEKAVTAVNPESGAALGTIPSGIGYYAAPHLAPGGVFQNGVCTGGAPGAGVDGNGSELLASPGLDLCGGTGTVVAYSMPSASMLWESPAGWKLAMGGANASLLLAKHFECTSSEAACLVAFDIGTGGQRWQVPLPQATCGYGEPCADLCAITAHQAMLGIGQQRSVIDVENGQQVSYANENCGTQLPGGIEVISSEENILGAPQHLEVIQALVP
jgi:hypothetical protein